MQSMPMRPRVICFIVELAGPDGNIKGIHPEL